MKKAVSQKTIVELMRALREYRPPRTDLEAPANYIELLYANDFPDWFVSHADYFYAWNWRKILMDMRTGRFFFLSTYSSSVNIVTGEKYLSEDSAKALGESLIQRLAAFATTLPTGESVLRSLQLDGFDVNWEKLALVPLGRL